MTIRILVGDCREVMKTLADSSVDSIVCDPPYELGFMSKSWDSTGVANDVETWRQCLRVLKPGGHLLAFGGTRTNHRMVCAIEDAGFEIRDQAAWLYGSGFPKSLDVSKAIDKAAGVARDLTRPGVIQRDGYGEDWDTGSSSSRPRRDAPATSAAKQWEGWGTALKPAYEPICMARKPLAKGMTVAANVLAHGTGAINVDGCRVGWLDVKAPAIGTPEWGGPAKKLTAMPGQQGKTVERAAPSQLGRWPANLLTDGSPEVVALFPQSAGQQAFVGAKHGDRPSINAFGDYGPRPDTAPRGDSGSAARFFWCSKTSAADRNDGTQKGQTWASEDHSHATEVLRRLQRATSDAMTLLWDDTEWSTTSFGNASAARFRAAIKSIIETTTRPTTPSETLNCSQPWSTSDCIQAATEIAKANGSSLAELVEFTSRLRASSTSASTESVLDAVLAALQMLLRASGNGSKGNFHATVKPTALMRYLCRLVTPPGGTILDPFMGSGSTLKAAELEGFNAIGIELSNDYAAIARRRIGSDAPLFAQAIE